MKKIIINTDGGSRGNPGKAAVGLVIQNAKGEKIKTFFKVIGNATNNEAEYGALIFALQKLKAVFGKEKIKSMEIEIRMDSELAVKQLNGEYKIEEEKLFPLYIKVHNLLLESGKVIFKSIPREQNKEADFLVNQALDAEQSSMFTN